MNLRQLPNAITLLRVASVLPLTFAIDRGAHVLALAVASAAALSDALDGFLARRFGWQTALGSLLDPIADKVLLTGCFVALWSAGAVPGWLLALVLGRDAVIVAGALAYHRFVAPVSGDPTWLGKVTTALQLGFVLLQLLDRAGLGVPVAVLDAGLVMVALATLASGIDYVVRWGMRALRDGRSAG
ncbi:CDP-alcohol phosphatidyltransferase family protein [Chiayiivirga flava]|uniref:CDP-diacylglycerol--glycerol-3-phosphate 3-phosphatidyltransferase n=1 Tax=Chiayiivirga flava TaxID=659595 RepID=A0A7W8G209_9GAMM|nr:CDP-alcohol phosphatidyltransferase family protein [Chiayiivirga flava]MBB5209453.1 cardiolipin synthase [Chiayiivirga flava]